MYGNKILPGVSVGTTYRNENSIWQGSPQSTWFKAVKITLADGETISAGLVVKEDISNGSFVPFTTDDIISASVENLPGVRLGIIADTEATEDGSILIGISGQIDKAKIFIGDTAFNDLTDAQKTALNSQFEAWNFQLVNVMQA